MRILGFSDLHRDAGRARAMLEASRNADVVVAAGDFATKGSGLADTIDILRAIEAVTILVAGNHDDLPALRQACIGWATAHILHGERIQVEGVDFFGLGFEVGDADRGSWNSQISEADAARALRACPEAAVLVTHAPPWGVADVQRDGSHDGSRAIRATVEHQRPRLHLCGHIHNSWGVSGRIGACAIHNLGPSANWFEI